MATSCEQASSDNAWTIGRLLAWTTEHLKSRDVDEPRLSAELLLAEAMGYQRIDLYARFEEKPTAEQRDAFRGSIRAAAEHKPIAQLIGHKEFYSLDFKVTPDVLIPRPETELLVERALTWCDEHPRDRHDLLDLGTGSGCIVVAIAKRQPSIHAVATDISEAAIVVARQNADAHNVSDRLRFVQADMFDLPAGAAPDGGFDVIVSNPPYVADHERETLPRNVRDHEPAVALFCGADGLGAYRRIAAGVANHLRPSGTLILEVGHTQAAAVEQIFTEHAGLELVGRFKDLSGIDRVVQLRHRAGIT